MMQIVMDRGRLTYSIAEVAAKTGTSIPFVRLEIGRGKLKAVRAGRRVLVPVEAVRSWLGVELKDLRQAGLEAKP
jgi:excisionase family DNA binding protein